MHTNLHLPRTLRHHLPLIWLSSLLLNRPQSPSETRPCLKEATSSRAGWARSPRRPRMRRRRQQQQSSGPRPRRRRARAHQRLQRAAPPQRMRGRLGTRHPSVTSTRRRRPSALRRSPVCSSACSCNVRCMASLGMRGGPCFACTRFAACCLQLRDAASACVPVTARVCAHTARVRCRRRPCVACARARPRNLGSLHTPPRTTAALHVSQGSTSWAHTTHSRRHLRRQQQQQP
jgi:hypothetical protein